VTWSGALGRDAYTRGLEAYAAAQSCAESDSLKRIRLATLKSRPDHFMMVGPLEAALLQLICRISGAKRILEIGTFTGYSALAFAEALPGLGRIVTLDVNAETTATAREHWASSGHGHKIQSITGPALNSLEGLKGRFDLAFVDADKKNYWNYFSKAFPLLRPGALFLFDNTLWGGEIMKPRDADGKAMAAFNRRLARDKRVETVMLTVSDGLTLARKSFLEKEDPCPFIPTSASNSTYKAICICPDS
jgi:caffeoyl-CoA O-methyltransferase